MINIEFFSPPDGDIINNPDLRFLKALILYGERLYWNSGAGQATVDFKSDEVESYLSLLFDEQFGFQLEFKNKDDKFYVSIGEGDFNTTTTSYVGGNKWVLPSKFFIAREDAWVAVEYFCESGKRCPEINWEKLEDQNWNHFRDE